LAINIGFKQAIKMNKRLDAEEDEQKKRDVEQAELEKNETFRERRRRIKQEKLVAGTIGRGLLNRLTPNSSYFFKSDYYLVDGGKTYGAILSYFHDASADDDLAAMWGISMIPRGRVSRKGNVYYRLMKSFEQMPKDWVDLKIDKADSVVNAQTKEADSGSRKQKNSMKKLERDVDVIINEISRGDGYLSISFRLMIQAKTLDELDNAIKNVQKNLKENFGGLELRAYDGQMQTEFSNLTLPASSQLGHNYYMTSTEAAGMYSLVTHGIEDPTGKFMGRTVHDINTAPVLWDVDDWSDHVVIGTKTKVRIQDNKGRYLNTKIRSSSQWGVRIAQQALLNNHRVVHFILNDTNLNEIGVDLSDITLDVGMNEGALNMFEIFGPYDEELTLYAAKGKMLETMVRVLNPSINDNGIGIVNEEFDRFYIDSHMWVENAAENRDKIRITGLNHQHVPRLGLFKTYLDQQYKAASENSRDQERISHLSTLRGLFGKMLKKNGDLFNVYTSEAFDEVGMKEQVVYHFNSLKKRGKEVMMAQFVNALGASVDQLEEGDVIIIHRTEEITDDVLEYTKEVLKNVRDKGVRIAYLFDDVNAMVERASFVELVDADYMIMGRAENTSLNTYEELIGNKIPARIRDEITKTDDPMLHFMRRGQTNTLFRNDGPI
jgi:hypothetical protein